jgi:hypothetical protein
MPGPQLDIFELRKSLIDGNILICFNGPFSHSIIEEIGTAVKRYLESDSASSSATTDVFAAFVELAQNLQAYTAALRGIEGGAGYDAGTLAIGRAGDRYYLSSGNAVKREDIEVLTQRLEELQGMDKDALKGFYKRRLREPRAGSAGAGLGLIDLARRSSGPFSYSIRDLDARFGFFSLTVVV